MFKNLHEMITQLPDEKSCREYLAKQRWPDGLPVCPYCGHKGAYNIEGDKRYKCKNTACHKKFSVTVGTIFHASNIPLDKWFMALYLVSAHKKGISSHQLARDLGIAQKNAWFMIHRIRETLKDEYPELLCGTVEADETYMSRKYARDYVGLAPDEIDYNLKNATKGKGAVLGIAERDTKKIRVTAFDENTADNVRPEVIKSVKAGSRLYTDESNLYKNEDIQLFYKNDTVTHSKREWVRYSPGQPSIHTNTVENFWSVMKRGVYGTYHQISFKHLQAYCNEFSYRYNTRKMKDADRFTLTLGNIERRLTYKQLVHGKTGQKETGTQKAE
jgi:transposase-like protein